MALEPMSPNELAQSTTLFASFMGDDTPARRTVGQLRAIYAERSETLHPSCDDDDNLRVDRFADDMAQGRWQDDVVMRIGEFGSEVLVVDGIHRGIAYLSCIHAGISPERLPALRVDR